MVAIEYQGDSLKVERYPILDTYSKRFHMETRSWNIDLDTGCDGSKHVQHILQGGAPIRYQSWSSLLTSSYMNHKPKLNSTVTNLGTTSHHYSIEPRSKPCVHVKQRAP